MSFQKNSTSFIRLIIPEISEEKKQKFEQRLRQLAFIPIDDVTAEKSAGFTDFYDLEDTSFSNPIQNGQYFFFAFRIDKRKISSTLFQKEYKKIIKKEQEILQEKGKKYITKERREEIKNQVKLRLMAKTLPTPAHYEAVWDLDSNIVYFSCTSKSVISLFIEFMHKALCIEENSMAIKKIQIFDCAELALKFIGNRFYSLEESYFVKKDLEEEPAPANIFLGEEFLTWLWMKSEKQERFEIGSETCLFDFENNMTVRGSLDGKNQTASVNGYLNPMKEARTGIKNGKKVNSATIVMNIHSKNDKIEFYDTKVKVSDLTFSGFKMGKIETEKDNEEYAQDATMLIKMDVLKRRLSFFDIAFKKFIECRADAEIWEEEMQKIKDWIMTF